MSVPADIPVPKDVSGKVMRALRRRRALWRFLEAICRATEAAGGRVHLVGGFVRDLVEGCPGKDIDLMLTGMRFDALGKVLESLPGKNLGLRRIVAAGRHFPVYRVATEWSEVDVDVALARSERSTGPGHRGPEVRIDRIPARTDASRRDFTINSLVVALRLRGNKVGGEVIDFFGGLSDLRRRRIRGVGDPLERIREDPLRILRAIRLKSERPGYTIEGRTWRAIRSAVPSLAGTIPGERTIGEIARALAADPPGAIDDLRRSGVLRVILPEVCGRSLSPLKRRFALLEGSLGRPLPETVLFANLLADAAAAEARGGRSAGAGLKVFRLPETEAIARRLHVPGVRRVVRLIEDVARLSWPGPVPNRNARIESIFGRWENPRWLLALYEASRAASSRPAEDFRPLLRKAARKRPLLTGKELLRMGIAAGPAVESLLERVRDATLSGEVSTRREAAALVASLSGPGAAPPASQRRSLPRRSASRSPANRTAKTSRPVRTGRG